MKDQDYNINNQKKILRWRIFIFFKRIITVANLHTFIKFAKPYFTCAKLFVFFVITLNCKYSFSSPLYKSPIFFKPEANRFTINGGYLSSTGNFLDNGGEFESLPDGNYYHLFRGSLDWDYTSSKNYAWTTGFSFAQSESSDGSFVRKNSGLDSLKLGINYLSLVNPIKVKPFFHVLIPLNNPSEEVDKSTYNEGKLQTLLGTWIEFTLFGLNTSGFIDYNYRNDGFSSLLEYGLWSELVNSNLNLGAGLHGFYSITDDEFTDTPNLRQSPWVSKNGESFKFYTVNPNVLTGDIFLNFHITEQSHIGLSLSLDLNGKNYAKASEFVLTYQWVTKDLKTQLNSKLKEKRKQSDLNKFEIDDDNNYDSEAFESNSTPKSTPKKDLDQMLNETEDLLDK